MLITYNSDILITYLKMASTPKNAILMFIGLFSLVSAQNKPTVTTTYGDVRGVHEVDEISGKPYTTFFGIPYAAAPVGERRFSKPVPPRPWTGVRDATSFGAACMQPPMVIPPEQTSEDCLFINVWIPYHLQKASCKPLPVMIQIHGGGYTFGAGHFPSKISGLEGLPIHGNIILVTFNYRLDTLGFFTTRDSNAPGNIGLWDCLEALKWTKQNIVNFGGDSDRITIFGQSAGGALTSQLMLATHYTKDLYHRVITQSGTTFISPWAMMVYVDERCRHLAEEFGCNFNDTMATVKCLQQQNASALVNGAVRGGWAPIVDGDIIPVPLHDLLENKELASVDYMGGSIHTEGYIPAYLMGGFNRTDPNQFLTDLEEYFKNKTEHGKLIFENVKFQYYWGDKLRQNITALLRRSLDMFHDWTFMAGNSMILRKHAEMGGNSYHYDFHHTPSISPFPVGVHADDLHYTLGRPLVKNGSSIFTEPEKQLSRDMISYWANFAETGNPNEGSHVVPVRWEKYDETQKAYLEITANMTSSAAKYRWREKEGDYWQDAIYAIITGCDKMN